MPAGPDPLRDDARGAAPDPATAALARAISVTRIARVTGLDRSGVEVAAAIRPGGHVLQVSNGKGDTFAEAARGAVAEAAELWAAERPVVHAWGSAREVALATGARVEPLGAPDDPARRPWTAGRDLATGAPVLVPAAAVFCAPAGSPLLGGAPAPWTSNGMGAHPDRALALLHALLEAVERDRLARALPEGFTEREVRARLVDPATLARAAPRTAARVRDLEARGFRVHLLDLGDDGAAGPLSPALSPAPRGRGGDAAALASRERGRDLADRLPSPPPGERGRERGRSRSVPLPTAAALLVDSAHSPVPLTAGYACRLAPDDALDAALLEAAQSRLTEIHGAREDVLHGDRHGAAALAAWCAAARPARDAGAMPSARARTHPAAVRAVLRRLDAAGFRRAIGVELSAPAGHHVVRAIVPGLLLSELL